MIPLCLYTISMFASWDMIDVSAYLLPIMLWEPCSSTGILAWPHLMLEARIRTAIMLWRQIGDLARQALPHCMLWWWHAAQASSTYS